MLQEMENAVGRDGESHQWKTYDAPPSAKSYFLRVLKLSAPAIPQRNLREMQTCCTLLDHLATGRVNEAGDVIAQRLKALEVSNVDGHWKRAEQLELVAAETTSLVNRSELKLAQKEVEADWKVAQPYSYGKSWQNSGPGKADPGWGQDWNPKGKGKGEYWKPKPKGDYWKPNPKGKDKGKGKKGKGKGKKDGE
jgi:hypothetical protein